MRFRVLAFTVVAAFVVTAALACQLMSMYRPAATMDFTFNAPGDAWSDWHSLTNAGDSSGPPPSS